MHMVHNITKTYAAYELFKITDKNKQGNLNQYEI